VAVALPIYFVTKNRSKGVIAALLSGTVGLVVVVVVVVVVLVVVVVVVVVVA